MKILPPQSVFDICVLAVFVTYSKGFTVSPIPEGRPHSGHTSAINPKGQSLSFPFFSVQLTFKPGGYGPNLKVFMALNFLGSI